MASIVKKIKESLRSPQVHALTDRAKQVAKDPKNKERVRDVVRRIRKR
ncbi:hypothetical protein [Amycolatopsis benzoatilytica]|nr:hypothetical protein [Amycolatopsis benzoatilytica]